MWEYDNKILISGDSRFVERYLDNPETNNLDQLCEELQNRTPDINLFLWRHGISENNERRIYGGNSSLTKKGIDGVELICSSYLISKEIEEIFASPLDRAVQTANIIKKHCKAPLTIIDSLREINLGLLENKSKNYFQENYPEEYRKRKEDKFNYRGDGENYLDGLLQVNPFLYNLLTSNKKRVVLIGHTDKNRVILYSLADNKDIDEKKAPSIRLTNNTIYDIRLYDIEVLDKLTNKSNEKIRDVISYKYIMMPVLKGEAENNNST